MVMVAPVSVRSGTSGPVVMDRAWRAIGSREWSSMMLRDFDRGGSAK